MSNVDRPFGARVARSGLVAPYNAAFTQYKADADRSDVNGFGNIYPGDFVTLEADGNVAPAASGDVILGVVMAAGPSDDTDHGRGSAYSADDKGVDRYLPADREGVVWVIDDPNIVVMIQEDATDDASALGDADRGETVNITATAGESHGSTFSSQSTVEIDSASDTDTATDLILLDIVDQEDNEFGAHAKWLARIANHYYNQ